MRILRAVWVVLVLGLGSAAGAGEPPAAPVTLADLLGDLAEAAAEIATVHPVAAPGPPWVDDLLDLARRGALTDPADVERARALVEKVRAWHEADATTRAGRQISANVAQDPAWGSYVRATLWRPPFLLCYATGERLADADWLAIEDPVARAQRRAEARGKQEDWLPLLEPLAEAVDRVQAEFLRRFGEPLGLRPLSEPHGGRPDLPAGVRSFPDGVATVLWVFADAASMGKSPYDDRGMGTLLHVHFDPATSWGVTHAGPAVVGRAGAARPAGPEDAAALRARVGWLAARQLLHWHARQRNAWKPPPRNENAVTLGLPAWLASHALSGADDAPAHAAEAAPLVQFARAFAKQGRTTLPVFPVAELFPGRGVGQAAAYGARTFGIDDATTVILWRHESSALFRFLDEAEGYARRPALLRLVDAYLAREPLETAAARALGIREEEERAALDEAFAAYVRLLAASDPP